MRIIKASKKIMGMSPKEFLIECMDSGFADDAQVIQEMLHYLADDEVLKIIEDLELDTLLNDDLDEEDYE